MDLGEVGAFDALLVSASWQSRLDNDLRMHLTNMVRSYCACGRRSKRKRQGPDMVLSNQKLANLLATIRAIMVGRCGPSVARPHKLCVIVTNAAHRPQH
jgi:hypothetical protein